MKKEEKDPVPQPTESEAVVAALRDIPGPGQVAPVPLPVDVAAGLPSEGPDREAYTVAKAGIAIAAPIAKVWEALVTPAMIKQYMFGAEVVSDWKEGSSITWRGDYQGKKYQDKGVVLKALPGRTLQYSHFSPSTDLADLPQNCHTVTVELTEQAGHTSLALTQDKNVGKSAAEQSSAHWQGMLETLKKMLENGSTDPTVQ